MLHGKTILIAGPTASGKSALASTLAERFGGTVINADSMQVYAEMRILTARPTAEEEARAPHRLYGHVPAREAYSAGRFLSDAAREVAATHAAGRLPIVVGGTGLYLKALLDGLSPIPPIPDDIRRRWREAGERSAPGELHRRLLARDPAMAARLDPADRQRIARALEVLEATGRSLADWQREPPTPLLDPRQTLRLVLRPARSLLHARCDARFTQMVASGALDEARTMTALDLDPGLPAMRAIGLRPLLAHVRGHIDLSTALELGQTETRQYVKRQDTWAKRHYIAWQSANANETERMRHIVFAFIQSQP